MEQNLSPEALSSDTSPTILTALDLQRLHLTRQHSILNPKAHLITLERYLDDMLKAKF